MFLLFRVECQFMATTFSSNSMLKYMKYFKVKYFFHGGMKGPNYHPCPSQVFYFETYLSQKIIVGHIIECFLQIIKLSCNE